MRPPKSRRARETLRVPIVAGDDQAQYEAMRDQIQAAVGPLDFLKEIWVDESHYGDAAAAPA